MAEQTILVCDICGQDAVESVTFRVGRQNYVLDYCRTHLSELTDRGRKPKRGRKAAAGTTASGRGRATRRRRAASGNGRRRRRRSGEEQQQQQEQQEGEASPT